MLMVYPHRNLNFFLNVWQNLNFPIVLKLLNCTYSSNNYSQIS